MTQRDEAESLLKIRKEYGHWTDYDQDQAAALLRSMAAEIERLKDELKNSEAAVIKRLAGVSVEPAFRLTWKRGAYFVDKPEIDDTDCYTAEALAAARVQALEEAANVCRKRAKACVDLQNVLDSDNLTDVFMRHHAFAHEEDAVCIRALIRGAA